MKKSNNYTTVILAGGSHSGKSSVLEMLKSSCNPLYSNEWNIKLLNEAATDVLAKNPNMPNTSIEFQKEVIKLQVLRENAAHDAGSSKNTLIVSDRGIADCFIYQRDEAENLLQMDMRSALDRYDICLYFLPFNDIKNLTDGNPFRCESSEEEISEIECRTRSLYEQHKRLFFIPTFVSLFQRAKYVATLINNLIGVALFCVGGE